MMENQKLFLNSKASENIKKHRFVPYQDKIRTAYFAYSGLFWFFGILVFAFSLFIIVNLAVNNKYQISGSMKDINIFCTPILNMVLVIFSWILLFFAPHKIYHNPKSSLIMLYFSFWFLVVSVLLNSQLQITYSNQYLDTGFYHWINRSVLIVLVVLMIFAMFFLQIFFWIMRHKFSFMPSDYEIYRQRSIDKKAKKALKKQNKLKK
ncbi:hypothetical protein [Spiroplasma attinicola]|uniref:hypothetical protein n=1 Tax=Spiroplasma attinicola TaxID=2904537 RepID=UPI002022AAFC|nr:hypothetical protein [Spiroplasma sp. JKS002671]